MNILFIWITVSLILHLAIILRNNFRFTLGITMKPFDSAFFNSTRFRVYAIVFMPGLIYYPVTWLLNKAIAYAKSNYSV